MASKEELEDILRAVVEGVLSDDVMSPEGWCPVCHEHLARQSKECALVKAANILEIDLEARG